MRRSTAFIIAISIDLWAERCLRLLYTYVTTSNVATCRMCSRPCASNKNRWCYWFCTYVTTFTKFLECYFRNLHNNCWMHRIRYSTQSCVRDTNRSWDWTTKQKSRNAPTIMGGICLYSNYSMRFMLSYTEKIMGCMWSVTTVELKLLLSLDQHHLSEHFGCIFKLIFSDIDHGC